ncbi:MAG: hypothetical protein GX594_19430 [Pirellulaceae bacterium]|nr:hypothetical protein [Pirellulaceae bacterium]
MAYATTTLDQHRTPEWLAEQQQKEREESASFDKTQADTTAARRQFEVAQREWRASRPEFRALCRGIKSELPMPELQVLAAAAGCGNNDLVDLIGARRRALDALPKVANRATDQKALATIDGELAAAEKKLGQAKTRDEIQAADDALWVLQNKRTPIFLKAIESKTLNQIVDSAKSAGLI